MLQQGSFTGMAREKDPALSLAENALKARLASQTLVDSAGYCRRPEDNLVTSVGPGVWRRARVALASGKGDELATKFRAAFSSSALAVNSFGPLIENVDLPGGLKFHGPIRFEQERSAWARGYWPTLDVIVEDTSSEMRLFVESKCIEFLRAGHVAFSDAFVKHARERLGPEATATYERLFEDSHAFDPLDARQLAKHFLAAKRAAVEARGGSRVLLLCITWEPADAASHPVFSRHRQAVVDFAVAVPDEHVTVGTLTYRDLWDYWEAVGDPVLARHTALLRERYDVRLNGQ